MDIKKDIKKILYGYMAVDSITNTVKENQIDNYFTQIIESIPYFNEHDEYYKSERIPEDPHGRSVNWAMLRGHSNKTIVMIHHSDVVTTENYKDIEHLAYKPDQLAEALLLKKDSLEEEANQDLRSGKWLFGRGSADMKGGGAIQLALLKHLSQDESFDGSIIVLAVPDEENLSAGMRYAVEILDRLKNKYNLNFQLMINSEPHQRLIEEKGVISQGSIAKMNIFVYARGVLAHGGKAYEGINPLGILSRMVSLYEMSTAFTDTVDGEMSIPPTWVYLRDLKEHYDVSMPHSAIGFLNLLNFTRAPEDILNMIKSDVEIEAKKIVAVLYEDYLNFMTLSRRERKIEPWPVKVLTFSELKDSVLKNSNNSIDYDAYREVIADKVKRGEMKEFDGTTALVEFLMNHYEEPHLIIILGLAAPYYPGVSNINRNDTPDFETLVNQYTENNFNQSYDNEYFFTGISDLSFSGMIDRVPKMEDMPLWGKTYNIPFEAIKSIDMQRINIGPWGKDFHKISERVFMEDLYERTPKIIKAVIDYMMET